MDIAQYSLWELESDRAACIEDNRLCEDALSRGIETYFDGHEDVRERMAQNTRIIAIIDAELARREEAV